MYTNIALLTNPGALTHRGAIYSSFETFYYFVDIVLTLYILLNEFVFNQILSN